LKHSKRKVPAVTLVRRGVQLAFLGFFAFLLFSAAYPPLGLPASNFFLRFDPLAGIFSVTTSHSLRSFAFFWPAWVLVVLTVLSSRFFCGWVCPLGTCFDIAGAVKPRALKYYRPDGRQMRDLLAKEISGTRPNRIRLKYVLLLIVVGLSFAGINLLYFGSPLVIANRSLYYLIVPWVPVLLLLLVLLAFLYRPRFWCEEICPMGALFSATSAIGKRLKPRYSPLSVVKDADRCISCGACYRDCPFGVDEPYTNTKGGRLRSADCTACGACVAACPSNGALAVESFGVPVFKSRGRALSRKVQEAKEERDNRALDSKLVVSRKEFIASVSMAAVLAAGYSVGIKRSGIPVLRMPGAQDESDFLAACNRCAECARACPTGCIRPMGLEAGLQKLWTPRFMPSKAACTFDKCNQACQRVCPAGAIKRLDPTEVRIGTAAIERRTCLQWKGGKCLFCADACRFKAIEKDSRNRPVVLAEKCTGCGACENICPVKPSSIVVRPLTKNNTQAHSSAGKRAASLI
jgi:polyferredoxin